VIHQTHALKTWPVYFFTVRFGEKTWELRENDRGFAVGDHLLLQLYRPGFGYLNEDGEIVDACDAAWIKVRVTYIAQPPTLMPGYCIMSIEKITEPVTP
jgi:ABC-type iron transport system FetAB ATPase subunit